MGQVNVNIQLNNNYPSFFQQFTTDTGLDPKKNVSEYIAYFNARMSDANYQLNQQYLKVILNEIASLRESKNSM